MANDAEIVVGIRGDVAGGRRVKRSLDEISRSGNKAQSSVAQLGRNITRFLGAAAVFQGLKRLTLAAAAFEKQMAEINTLLQDQNNFQRLEKNLRAVNKEFGGDRAKQAKALYDIISAGTSDAAAATRILTAANKLAIGGVTDVATAADGLTSVLNAYGESVGTAEDVSDAFFVAVKAGKTTVDQLANSIGLVAPLASEAGVSLEELLAATAALTKGGIDTSIAMRGLRQIMANLVKPTSEAAAEAKRIGLEFDATAIQTKGLAGFLQDLIEKTGGSTDSLSLLFGNVESLVPILSLAKENGEEFNVILDSMAGKAGATEEAFQKLNATFDQQTSQLLAKINDEFLTLGNGMIGTLLPAVIILNENFDEIISTMDSMVAPALAIAAAIAFAPASLVAAMSLLAAGLTLAVAKIAGFEDALRTKLAPVIDFIRDKAKSATEALREMIGLGRSDDLTETLETLQTPRQDLTETLETLTRPEPKTETSTKKAEDSLKRSKDTIEKFQKLLKSTRTEQEKFNERIKELNELRGLAKTAEELEAIDRAIEQAGEEFEKATDKIKDTEDGVSDLSKEMDRFANSTAKTFSDFVSGTISAKDALRSLLSDLQEFVLRETVTSPLKGVLGSVLGGVLGGGGGVTLPTRKPSGGGGGGIFSTIASGIGSFFGGGFGFNSGGSMVLGGNAGFDQNTLSLNGAPIASTGRGEVLSISPAGQTGSGGGVVVNQTINVSTGVQETVQSEIVALLPSIQEATRSSILEADRRGFKT